MIKRSLVAALALVMVLACQNPFSSTPGSTNSATRSLTISWHVGNANGRTLFPPSYPTPSTYDVLLHPTIGTDISQTGLSGTTWTFNNLSSVVYTITVAGKDGGGYVIVSGSGTADLTIASVQNPTITLSYISSGTGTGQIHLTFDASGAGATVTATALTLVDPSGATIVNGASLAGSSPTFSYTNTSATVGSYQMFATLRDSSIGKEAMRIDTALVFQNVDTAVTITLTSGDFNDIYVPVTGLSLSAGTMTLNVNGPTGSLTAALSPANASNTIVSWSSDMPAVATVDQNGTVRAIAPGTATVTATSIDYPSAHDTCSVTVFPSVVGTWQTTRSFSTARFGHASVAYNGYLYVVAGQGSGGYLNTVQSAPLDPNGTVGNWLLWTFVSPARMYFPIVGYNGNLYVIGGYNYLADSSSLNDVQYVPLYPDGTGGAWQATTTFSPRRGGHTSVVYNSYLYIIGGINAGGSLDDVQFAPLNPDGTIGAWQTTTSFAVARRWHTSVAYNGYLYVIGGLGADGAALNDVRYAALSPDGTVGTWQTTTSFATPRWGHSSVVYNGSLYIIGGGYQNGSNVYLNDVQYAPFSPDGTLGGWQTTASFPTARFLHTSVVYNGYLYVIGGYNGGYLADVQYAPLN